jgi:hypothetical protein
MLLIALCTDVFKTLANPLYNLPCGILPAIPSGAFASTTIWRLLSTTPVNIDQLSFAKCRELLRAWSGIRKPPKTSPDILAPLWARLNIHVRQAASFENCLGIYRGGG